MSDSIQNAKKRLAKEPHVGILANFNCLQIEKTDSSLTCQNSNGITLFWVIFLLVPILVTVLFLYTMLTPQDNTSARPLEPVLLAAIGFFPLIGLLGILHSLYVVLLIRPRLEINWRQRTVIFHRKQQPEFELPMTDLSDLGVDVQHRRREGRDLFNYLLWVTTRMGDKLYLCQTCDWTVMEEVLNTLSRASGVWPSQTNDWLREEPMQETRKAG